ncbi:uncharacterized protein [Canis lupus baileyi]|uniref:uncharacterized protein n=1 Tax=Canis lupus baileyi TaxID=143281 RepID=UPI003B9766C0
MRRRCPRRPAPPAPRPRASGLARAAASALRARGGGGGGGAGARAPSGERGRCSRATAGKCERLVGGRAAPRGEGGGRGRSAARARTETLPAPRTREAALTSTRDRAPSHSCHLKGYAPAAGHGAPARGRGLRGAPLRAGVWAARLPHPLPPRASVQPSSSCSSSSFALARPETGVWPRRDWGGGAGRGASETPARRGAHGAAPASAPSAHRSIRPPSPPPHPPPSPLLDRREQFGPGGRRGGVGDPLRAGGRARGVACAISLGTATVRPGWELTGIPTCTCVRSTGAVCRSKVAGGEGSGERRLRGLLGESGTPELG